MLDRSQVIKLRAVEKDLSLAALVAGLIKISLNIVKSVTIPLQGTFHIASMAILGCMSYCHLIHARSSSLAHLQYHVLHYTNFIKRRISLSMLDYLEELSGNAIYNAF